jgi:hypothetical protein
MEQFVSSCKKHFMVWQRNAINRWSSRNDGGCFDIEKSKAFYADILGYDTVVYDKEGVFDDFKNLPSGSNKVRRVLLKHSKPKVGAFSQLLGESKIELVKGIRPHTTQNI